MSRRLLIQPTFSAAGKRGLFGRRLLRAGGRRRQQRLATAAARLAGETRRLAAAAALDGLGGAVLPWLLLLDVCSPTGGGKRVENQENGVTLVVFLNQQQVSAHNRLQRPHGCGWSSPSSPRGGLTQPWFQPILSRAKVSAHRLPWPPPGLPGPGNLPSQTRGGAGKLQDAAPKSP